jgi:hypothetical protein
MAKKRINPTHLYLIERGWVRVEDVRLGGRVQARWTNPRFASQNRTWSTSEAEYKEMREPADGRAVWEKEKGITLTPEQLQARAGLLPSDPHDDN